MAKFKYVVDLTDEERDHLLGLTRRGRSSARNIKRVHILLKADQDLSDEQIAEVVGSSSSTVHRTRKRFVEGGLGALDERPRKEALQDFNRRYGLTRHAAWLAETPAGTMVVALHQGPGGDDLFFEGTSVAN